MSLSQERSGMLSDSTLNTVSYGVMVCVGAALNIGILYCYDASALGAFNQVYAFYVVFTQLFVLGLNDSVQRHTAVSLEDPRKRRIIELSALVNACFCGFFASLLYKYGGDFFARLTQSGDTETGIFLTTPAVFFFILNKVLFGILAGRKDLRSYAVFQITRSLYIFAAFAAILLLDLGSEHTPAVFTAAELLLTPFLLLKIYDQHLTVKNDLSLWCKQHLSFGLKLTPNSVLAEACIRVDILMLGVFLSDTAVGYYSFIALFCEGIYQFGVAIRNVMNPRLARILISKDYLALKEFIKGSIKYLYIANLLIVLALIIAFRYIFPFIFDEMTLSRGIPAFVIISTGLLLYSAWIPFDHIFIQAGKPGLQSVFMLVNVLLNIALNCMFIPFYGIYGAALATSITYVFSLVNLHVLFITCILGSRAAYSREIER